MRPVFRGAVFLLVAFVVLWLQSCGGNDECDCPEIENRGEYPAVVARDVTDLKTLKFSYDETNGKPYVLTIQNDTSIILYWYDGRQWKPETLAEGSVFEEADFFARDGVVTIFYTSRNGDNVLFTRCKFDVEGGSLTFTNFPLSGIRFFSVLPIRNSSLVDVFYIDDAGKLNVGQIIGDDVSITEIDDGSKEIPEGAFGGSLYFDPVADLSPSSDVGVLYMDIAGPWLKVAMDNSASGWTVDLMPKFGDIKPAPDFAMKWDGRGGMNIVFSDQITRKLYYAHFATSWTMNEINMGEDVYPGNLQMIRLNDRDYLFFYDFYSETLRFAYHVEDYFDENGNLITNMWKGGVVFITEKPSDHFVVRVKPDMEGWLGMVIYDGNDGSIYLMEVPYEAL